MAKFGRITLRVRGNDHLPPHFHVDAPDFAALVTIHPLAVHAGWLPPDIWDMVRNWALTNRDVLITEWNRWNPNLRMEA